MTVGGTKCVDVLLAALPGIDQITAPPGEARLLQQMNQQNVGHQPGMTAITVGEGMDCREAVMEADGNLVERIAAMLQPDCSIGAEIAQFRGYLP